MADVLVEGVDDGVARELVLRRAFSSRFERALAQPPAMLHLETPLQIAVWQSVVRRAGRPVRTDQLAKELSVSREHLSRSFAVGRAPTLKRVIDLVRVLAAAELSKNAGYDVRDVAQVLGFASSSHLSSTTQRLVDVREEDFDFIFDTNVRGAFFVAQAVGSRMLARAKGLEPGTFAGGRIINIASMAAMRVLPQIGVYCMSKSAVVQMTKAMALEWGKHGINVNAICPGYIDTEINHHHWQTEQGQKLVNMLPRKRVGHPKDLDALLVMLASPQSDFINGAVISADDGFGV
jgi:NAD(P)-dependent dehydrogenase (short-subunit alcohol dehydrogenase family)